MKNPDCRWCGRNHYPHRSCKPGDLIPMMTSLRTQLAAMQKEKKADAVAFFRWWHNQPGTNTEQGYDKWLAEQALKETKK